MSQDLTFIIHHITNFPNSFVDTLSNVSLSFSIHSCSQTFTDIRPSKIITSDSRESTTFEDLTGNLDRSEYLEFQSSSMSNTKDNRVLFSHEQITFHNVDCNQTYKLKIDLIDEHEEKWSSCKLDLRKIVREGHAKKSLRMNVPMSAIHGIKPTISITYTNPNVGLSEVAHNNDQTLLKDSNQKKGNIRAQAPIDANNLSGNNTFQEQEHPLHDSNERGSNQERDSNLKSVQEQDDNCDSNDDSTQNIMNKEQVGSYALGYNLKKELEDYLDGYDNLYDEIENPNEDHYGNKSLIPPLDKKLIPPKNKKVDLGPQKELSKSKQSPLRRRIHEEERDSADNIVSRSESINSSQSPAQEQLFSTSNSKSLTPVISHIETKKASSTIPTSMNNKLQHQQKLRDDVLSQFSSRSSDICLENYSTNQSESIQTSKERPKTSDLSEIDFSRELNFSGILKEFDRVSSPPRNKELTTSTFEQNLHSSLSKKSNLVEESPERLSERRDIFQFSSGDKYDNLEEIDCIEQLTQKDLEIDDLKKEISDLRRKNRLMQKESTYSELFQMYESDISKLREENQALLKENQDINTKYQRDLLTKHSSNESLGFYVYSHYRELKQENQQMKNKMYRILQSNGNALSQSNTSGISRVQSPNGSVFREGSGAVLRRKIQQLTDKIDQQKTEIDQKNIEITKLKMKIRRYAHGMGQTNQSIKPKEKGSELTGRLESTIAENETLRKDLIDSRKQLLELSEQYENLQQHLESVIQKSTKLEKNLRKREAKMKSLKEQLGSSAVQVEELRELRRPEALIHLSQQRPVVLPGERREINALFAKMAKLVEENSQCLRVLDQLRDSFLNLEHECLDSRASELSYIELLMDYKEQLQHQIGRQRSPEKRSTMRRSISRRQSLKKQ